MLKISKSGLPLNILEEHHGTRSNLKKINVHIMGFISTDSPLTSPDSLLTRYWLATDSLLTLYWDLLSLYWFSTKNLTIVPPNLNNPYFYCLPNIRFKSGVSFFSFSFSLIFSFFPSFLSLFSLFFFFGFFLSECTSGVSPFVFHIIIIIIIIVLIIEIIIILLKLSSQRRSCSHPIATFFLLHIIT